jgi:hypothetical protein
MIRLRIVALGTKVYRTKTVQDSAVSTSHQFFMRRSSLQEEKVCKTKDAIPLWKSYDKAGS